MMNRHFLILIALLMTGLAAMAAPNFGEERLQHLARALELDENQAEKVKTIMQEQHEKMKQLKSQTKERLATVLDEDQMRRLEHMHEHRMQKMMEMQQGMSRRQGSSSGGFGPGW